MKENPRLASLYQGILKWHNMPHKSWWYHRLLYQLHQPVSNLNTITLLLLGVVSFSLSPVTWQVESDEKEGGRSRTGRKNKIYQEPFQPDKTERSSTLQQDFVTQHKSKFQALCTQNTTRLNYLDILDRPIAKNLTFKIINLFRSCSSSGGT